MIQLRKLGNEHMNKDEFVQFWMVFYDKFFKIDTNQVEIRSVLNHSTILFKSYELYCMDHTVWSIRYHSYRMILRNCVPVRSLYTVHLHLTSTV